MAMSNHSDNAVENTVLSGDEEVRICYFDLLSIDEFFLEKKNYAGYLLKTKWLMKICISRRSQVFLSNCNVQFYFLPFLLMI